MEMKIPSGAGTTLIGCSQYYYTKSQPLDLTVISRDKVPKHLIPKWEGNFHVILVI